MAPPSTCARMSGSSLAMHRRMSETREKVLRREHPDTLSSVSNLGNVLFIQGKYEEAETMYQQVHGGPKVC